MRSWKQTRRAMRRPFETAFFLVFKTLIPLLPRILIVGMSHLSGHLAVRLPLRDTRIGMKNLDAVFGTTRTRREKRRILASSLATFAQTMLDVIWFSRHPEKRIPEYSTFETTPETESFFDEKPLLCITAHMGSWELMGQSAALQGADLASIAAPIKNSTVNRILIQQRERTGQTIVPRKGALRTLIARFKKNGKAAFLLDQHTSEKQSGIIVDFLGLPMSVSSAPAALAYRTGTEIMFGFCIPQPRGRYRIQITKSITPPAYDKSRDTDEIVRNLTQEIEDVVSEQILKHPEYWLWSYRHWRRVPGGNYPANFPEY